MLFKYLNEHRVDVLLNGKLYFAKLAELNDPFEGMPALIYPTWTEYKAAAESEISRHMHLIKREKDKRRFYSEHLEMFRKKFEENYGKNSIEHYQYVVQKMSDALGGVLCLSKVPDNILMWAHYAGAHKGYVLGFDSSHEWFKYGMTEMKYSKLRPEMEVRPGKHGSEFISTKSPDWSYEQEVRKMHIAAKEFKQLDDGGRIAIPDYDRELSINDRLISFPPESLMQIIIGWKMDSGSRASIMVKSIKYCNAQVYNAYPDEKEYKMKIIKS